MPLNAHHILAPHAPMRHVVVVGILGFITGSAGAIVAISMADLGPDWYPIALALTGFPCVWLGGVSTVSGTRNDEATRRAGRAVGRARLTYSVDGI